MFHPRQLQRRETWDTLASMRTILLDLLKRTLILSLGMAFAGAVLAILISRLF